MQSIEIDKRLQKLSDTEIMLNFAQALGALYPFMKKVGAHCYDPYDEITEPLFYSLVYGAFSFKYGVNLNQKGCHVYDSVGLNYENTMHIRVIPKRVP